MLTPLSHTLLVFRRLDCIGVGKVKSRVRKWVWYSEKAKNYTLQPPGPLQASKNSVDSMFSGYGGRGGRGVTVVHIKHPVSNQDLRR